MTVTQVVEELKSLGNEATKKILMKHGAQEPFYGVKVEHLKRIQKRIKVDHALALALYDTGISDAMYLAGLIADDSQMTKKDLQRWADQAYWYMLSEYTVPWVTAGSGYGREMALKWIDAKKERIASAGWSTLSGLVTIQDDGDLDLAELTRLLKRVQNTIHQQLNRVRYTMNGFVIAVGCYVSALTDLALKTGQSIGNVEVDMGGTACKLPYSPDYIKKVQQRGTMGKKRKTVKC
ncbi:MAG: DNA alkylation repair protein [Gemmataceae bacterium]